MIYILASLLSSKNVSWIYLLTIIVGSISLTIFGMYNLVQLGLLSIGIPIILVSLLAILKPNSFEEYDCNIHEPLEWRCMSVLNSLLLFIFLYISSICILLVNSTRIFGYFILISMMASLIFFEAISFDHNKVRRKYIILTQIIVLFLNLTLGHTLRVPMITFTDIFYHMGMIEKIINSGYVTSGMGFYEYFPLFHIFNSIGLLLTKMEIKFSYFILSEFIFICSILLVFLIVYNATKNTNLSLVSALIYTFCPPVIDSGMYVVTRTAAYVMCLFILYLLISEKNLYKKIISIFLIIPLVLMHQTTLVAFTGILFLLIIISKVITNDSLIKINYPILFLISYVSYWIYKVGPFFVDVITMFTTTTEVTAANVEPEPISNLFYLLNNFDYFVLIFLMILGIISSLNQNNRRNKMCHIFGIVSFFLFPLFLPGISGIFSPVLGYRLPILLSPFIAFVISIGSLSLIKIYNVKYVSRKRSLMIVLFLLFSFFLLSSTLSGKTDDYNALPDPFGEKDRDYFKESELRSFQFMKSYEKNSNLIFSDYTAHRYLAGYLRLHSSCSSEFMATNISRPNSYFVFREEEYKNKGKLYFYEGIKYERFYWRLKSWKLDQDPSPVNSYFQEMKIYDNQAVHVYKEKLF